jgi:hypothetical protein
MGVYLIEEDLTHNYLNFLVKKKKVLTIIFYILNRYLMNEKKILKVL